MSGIELIKDYVRYARKECHLSLDLHPSSTHPQLYVSIATILIIQLNIHDKTLARTSCCEHSISRIVDRLQ